MISPASAESEEAGQTDNAAQEENTPTEPPESGSKLNILVAEDNPINWMLVRALLNKLGHKSELAENGHEAVSLSTSGSFDVVLMDLHMPGLDGLEASQKLEQQKKIPPPVCQFMSFQRMLCRMQKKKRSRLGLTVS